MLRQCKKLNGALRALAFVCSLASTQCFVLTHPRASGRTRRLHVLADPNRPDGDMEDNWKNGRGIMDSMSKGRQLQFIEDMFELSKKLEEREEQEILESDLCLVEPCEIERNRENRVSLLVDDVIRFIPAIFPFVSYALYDPTAELFAATMDFMSNNNWVPADGGAYKAKIIAPAINGIVVPSISILFATLISNTIGTLRERQLVIRNAINLEAGQLRMLQSLINSFPRGKIRDKCRLYLYQYCNRIIVESHETVDLNGLESSGMDSELNGIFDELNALSLRSDTAEAVPPMILGESYNACRRLFEERSRRITYLQSTFPALHYLTVATLAMSICVAFLMETNQELLVFLNAVQLRLMWSVLVGSFSALAIVSYDLQNPFRGSYEITKCIGQLRTIRADLKTSLNEGRINGWK